MPLTNNAYSADLQTALLLADKADAITLARFQDPTVCIHTKPDLTPVTEIDHAVEQSLRDFLTHNTHDEILGEEFGGIPRYQGRQWVIDPIDATKNFIRGIPLWATLIALLDQGIVRVGVVSAPALGRRWWACQDQGAFCSVNNRPPQRLAVSSVSELSQASLSLSSLSGWAQRGLRSQLLALTDQLWRVRGYGDFWHYCLVAEGAVDIAIEPEVSLWDLAAVDILVREAGGIFTNLDGIAGPSGGSAVASNGRLHPAVLNALQKN